jgi:hypothetical protein
MYDQGLWASDEVMKNYVDFICSQIKSTGGASVRKADGFPMKGCYVPVKLEITAKKVTYAEMRVTSLGHTKEFVFFMSRHKSPNKTLNELQAKINETVESIVVENGMDKDEIWSTHHPLKNLKLPE